MKLFGKRTPPPEPTRRRDAPMDRQGQHRPSPVFSYYKGQQRHAQQQLRETSPSSQSPKRSQRRTMLARLPRGVRSIPSYLFVGVLIVAVLYSLSLSGSPRVVVEEAPGTAVVRDHEQYAQEVADEWRRSWRHYTKFTANTSAFERSMREQYRELEDVRVQLPLLGRRPTIVLVPTAAALQIVAQNGTFYVDRTGKALVDISAVSTTDGIPVVRDNSQLAIDPGTSVLPSSHVAFILQLLEQLEVESIPVASLTLSNTAVNQIELRTPDHDYFVKFQLDDPRTVRQAVGSYLAVRKRLTADGVRLGEYLDVRLPEKAFYR